LEGKSDLSIREFQLFKNAMFPFVASLVSLNVMMNQAKDMFKANNVNKSVSVIICCLVKVMSS